MVIPTTNKIEKTGTLSTAMFLIGLGASMVAKEPYIGFGLIISGVILVAIREFRKQ